MDRPSSVFAPFAPLRRALLRRREVVLPTWKGWLLLIAVLAALAAVAGRVILHRAHAFLAVHAPVGGEVLVVEGWIPDYALRRALADFRAGRYTHLITTGGPLPEGLAVSGLGSYARLAAATLESFGLSPDSITAVPSPAVRKDRTYAEGLALAAWMRRGGTAAGDDRRRSFRSLDVYSFSAHARRSRLLYALVLGPGVRVGVYAPADREYDAGRWWTTSGGVRRTLDEWIGYLYAKCHAHGRRE